MSLIRNRIAFESAPDGAFGKLFPAGQRKRTRCYPAKPLHDTIEWNLPMTVDEMISSYSEAWNKRDADALLALLHPGAAYYDAFWMETCVGRDLDTYFRDLMREVSYSYKDVGRSIQATGGIILRYAAFDDTSSKEPLFHGAEILQLRDDKILSITDFYCDPTPEYLQEVADIAARRHGVPSHTTSGLGGRKTLLIRNRLNKLLQQKQAFNDPELTASDLADRVRCSEEHLNLVVAKYFEQSPAELINTHRVAHARSIIAAAPEQANILERAANESGFDSIAALVAVFVESYGFHPQDICHNWPPSIDSLAELSESSGSKGIG